MRDAVVASAVPPWPVPDGRPKATVQEAVFYGSTRCATKVIGPVSQRSAPLVRVTRTFALRVSRSEPAGEAVLAGR
jgi:hypothetical protein